MKEIKEYAQWVTAVTLCFIISFVPTAAAQDSSGEKHIYNFINKIRSKSARLGPIGISVEYLKAENSLKVENIVQDGPANGLLKIDDIITGTNGVPFKEQNPFVVIGTAITEAEAEGGRLVLNVTSEQEEKSVIVTIPVQGSYGSNWPLDCRKSKKIISQTALYYYEHLDRDKSITSALGYLFLLSTGDDQFLPNIRDYLMSYQKNTNGEVVVGDHTWHNGYNGILVGEYFLRTGDKAVLPLLQAFCDNAKERQFFGIAWGHWGRKIHPGYTSGGLMNPASGPVLTTLLLGKMCGVNVDEATLIGALEYFYRFAGHGGVAYGDHRAEGALGTNGKTGMIAAAMQVATGAEGDTSIYRTARDVMAMQELSSYGNVAMGHGDDGMGDTIWRGISTALVREIAPAQYQSMMKRLAWFYDLARQPDGSMGLALNYQLDNAKYGAATALTYTAPLKTLCITGAPRSEYAVPFNLPEKLWGTKADLEFHLTTHHPDYFNYGNDEPTHIPLWRLGTAHTQPTTDLNTMPLSEMLKNVHHQRYSIRCQAAKALRKTGRLHVLEGFLAHPDPRLRRAALDGLIDWNYWGAVGHNKINSEAYTSGIMTRISEIFKNPDESWYVIEGALFAMADMPAKVISKHIDAITPWTTHREWWLRDAAFAALAGLKKSEKEYINILPTLIEIFISEYRTMPRERMLRHFRNNTIPEAESIINAGLRRAIVESEIKSGKHAREGAYNVVEAVNVSLANDPDSALVVANFLPALFDTMSYEDLVRVIASERFIQSKAPGEVIPGLYSTLDILNKDDRRQLVAILHGPFRRALITKFLEAEAASEPVNNKAELFDTISDLAKLKDPQAGWQVVGDSAPENRVWRFNSFDPIIDSDRLNPAIKRRYRQVTLPASLKGWFKADYDDRSWLSGLAPIGRGTWPKFKEIYQNQSDWGHKEFLVARTNFNVTETYDYYQLKVVAKNGFEVYLQGEKINTYAWWKDHYVYRSEFLNKTVNSLLSTGNKTLAVFANKEYPATNNPTSWPDTPDIGLIDCYIEGMKASDLELDLPISP